MKQGVFIAVLLSTVLFCSGCTDNSAETTALAEVAKITEATTLVETTKLAKSGNAIAQSRLGNMYAKGSEVPQDFAVATQWFIKAAKQGNAEAQYFLGVIYSGGFVAPPDYVDGYVWFCLAAKSGFENSSEDCDVIANKLSAEELVAAKLREAKLFEEIQQRKME